jgi:hypothetical protein
VLAYCLNIIKTVANIVESIDKMTEVGVPAQHYKAVMLSLSKYLLLYFRPTDSLKDRSFTALEDDRAGGMCGDDVHGNTKFAGGTESRKR